MAFTAAERQRRYRERHPERVQACRKRCRAAKPDTWAKDNPERYQEMQRQWRAQNRDKSRGYTAAYRERIGTAAMRERERVLRFKKLGVDVADVPPKPEACPVCNSAARRMCLDHCHDSGRIRGWICYACNLALGYVRDSPATLRKLADYLEHQ